MIKQFFSIALFSLALAAQDSPPEVLKKLEPSYSEEAREARWTGTITASVTIDEMGSVKGVNVQEHPGMGMDKQVVEAVRQWKFKPAQKNGKAVEFTATVKFNFQLE